jgi:hypothetical protein
VCLFVQVPLEGGSGMYESEVSDGVSIEPIKDEPGTEQSMALSRFRCGVDCMPGTINGVSKQRNMIDIRTRKCVSEANSYGK